LWGLENPLKFSIVEYEFCERSEGGEEEEDRGIKEDGERAQRVNGREKTSSKANFKEFAQ